MSPKLDGPSTLRLATHAKRRAAEFIERYRTTARRPAIRISIFEPPYEPKEIRHIFLQGFLAALEELRREQLDKKEAT